MELVITISLILFSALLVLYLSKRSKRKKEAKLKVKQFNIREKTYLKILNWLNEEKKYLDPGLKIDHVAKGIHLTEREVSSAINLIAGENFNAFINRLRIKEAQSMLINPKYHRYTIDAIAEMAGFSNKVSFYQAFKKISGVSPRDFRKNQ